MPPPTPGDPRKRAAERLLSPVISACQRARSYQDRPVTPEVAGSSPVAPVSTYTLQTGQFCCRSSSCGRSFGQQTGSTVRPSNSSKSCNTLRRAQRCEARQAGESVRPTDHGPVFRRDGKIRTREDQVPDGLVRMNTAAKRAPTSAAGTPELEACLTVTHAMPDNHLADKERRTRLTCPHCLSEIPAGASRCAFCTQEVGVSFDAAPAH